MHIGMIGTGYVGLVSGTCFAEVGHDVICMDSDITKIAKLKDGILPIYEPGLEELVSRNLQSGRLSFSTDLKMVVESSQVVFIAVGTPPGEDGSADLKYVLEVARGIGSVMTTSKMIINKSTVPVGTGNLVKETIEEELKKRNLSHLEADVVSNPEFLKEGEAINDCMRPDRIVVGCSSEKSKQDITELFEPFLRNGHPIVFMDVYSAEITKYAANGMLATRISFMNELSVLCEKVGADIQKVREGIGTDSRIGIPFLYAGLGYGGSCFPKDVRALASTMKTLGLDSRVLDAVQAVNQNQRERFGAAVVKKFDGSLKGKTIGFWGLAFKPKTDDMREAPSSYLAELFESYGAKLRVFDPVAHEAARQYAAFKNAYFAQDMYDVAEGVDALLLITEWTEFRNPRFEVLKQLMRQPLIFDGRNQFLPEKMKRLGFEYYSVGRN